MTMYDYASILFSGKCNAKCPTCIGNYPEFQNIPSNLDTRQLRGLEEFLEKVSDEDVRYISLSGINTDPQQYKFESELIKQLRTRIPKATLSLHTNGRLTLQKLEELNSYDRATLSFPSFDNETYKLITGMNQIDIQKIIGSTQIPIKLSMLLTKHNQQGIEDYIRDAKELDISRIAIRKLVGRENEFQVFKDKEPITHIFDNPVYKIDDVEVTIWNYEKSTIRGLYLFPDGSLKDRFRK